MARGADLYAFAALWRHYRTCRRNKRTTRNALAFEIDAEARLLALQRELREHTYRPGRSICFVTGGPKPREVFAADFQDRIVHHLLVFHLERVFEPRFIHDSYACRRGKGTLAASDRLMEFLRRATAKGHRGAWALRLDVASFFASIHKQTLYDIIAQRVRDPEILWLTRTILFHDPTRDYRFSCRDRGDRCPETEGYLIPAEKSLFGTGNQHGLPIGNLTSQFWANAYLNELDQFVKRRLGCRCYARYVDDLVLLSGQPAELIRWRGEIEEFLQARLRLRLRTGGQEPMPVRRGIDFVGWKTWWNRRVPRRRTLSHMRCRVERFERRTVRSAFGGLGRRLELRGTELSTSDGAGKWNRDSVERLRQSLASYAGHLWHGATWGAWSGVWLYYRWLGLLFRQDGWTFSARWADCKHHDALCLRDRYAHVLRGAGEDCLTFCRVGRYVEFYGPQRLMAERVLGLRHVYLPRAGYAFTAGFPVVVAARFVQRALSRGCPVVLVPSQHSGGFGNRIAILWPQG